MYLGGLVSEYINVVSTEVMAELNIVLFSILVYGWVIVGARLG